MPEKFELLGLPRWLERTRWQRIALRYAMAVAFTAVAVAARVALLPLTGPGAPYLMLFNAVLATSYCCGPGPGILSSVLGAYLGPVLFGLHAPITTALGPPWAQMALFFLEGASVAYITHGFSKSRSLLAAQAASLRRSEERYEMAAQATLDCIWDWDFKSDEVAFSETLHTVFSYPRAQQHTNSAWWLAHVHPEDEARVRQSLATTFAEQGQKWLQEYRFATGTGSYLHVLNRSWVIYDEAGKPKRMTGAIQNITQRKDGERVLSEANARLRLITDALPALVAYLDSDGKHRFVSAEYERWFNKPRSAILGRTIEEFLGGSASSPELRSNMRRALGGEQVRFEDRLEHPSRGCVHTSNTFIPDFDEQDSVRGIVCLVYDVSEQKQAEAILRESEEHYRILAEVVPQMIWESRGDGTFTYVNSQWLRYAGMTQQETFGHGWLSAVHPSQHEKTLQHWRRGTEREWEAELLVKRASDGTFRWHALRALALVDAQGEVRKWIGSFIDIHDRRQAAQELQTLADFIPQLAWVADPQGNIYWFNQRWWDFTGEHLDNMRGTGWYAVVHPDHREAVQAETRKSWANGTSFEGTFPMRGKDGTWQWFLTRAIPIHDGSGRIHRWFGTSTDIHQQLEVQNRLERAQLDLETAVRARDEFLSIASHELKTPLTSLQLVAQMAERNLNRDLTRACEPVRVRKLVDQTGKSVARLTRLVDDMLDTSRIAMGKLSFKAEHFDLTDLVTEVVERTQPQAHANENHIQVLTTAPVWGDWDRFRIEQVVINLLTNALRYGEGSPIEVSVACDDTLATLRVTDHGPGIALAQQGRIFQQFERATPHSSISGLGLGLFICKEIVERHGGNIAVHSVAGEGAVFEVKLPLVMSEASGMLPPTLGQPGAQEKTQVQAQASGQGANLPRTNAVA